MSKTTKDIMKDVCTLSLKDELHNITNLNISDNVYQSLPLAEIEQLARKILLLPPEYRHILFFRYCFNCTPSETDEILDTEDSISKLRYIQKMLAGFMKLEHSWIDEDSMGKACEIALVEDTKEYDNTTVVYKPNYSTSFKRKLKDIKITQNPNKIYMLIAKRVAVIILISILCFSTILVVNAEIRENVFHWIIETFPKFSIFTPEILDSDSNPVELKSLKINYIPMGFELKDIHEGRKMLIYNYLADGGQEIIIKLLDPSGAGKSYYDTENSEIEEIIFKGSQAYTWKADNITYLIWSKDGIECHISGNLNKDEILKIAENISK